MPREVPTAVPAELAPAWRDLPALAWVTGRAFAPATIPRWLAACVAAVALPWWLICFVGMHGRIAASNRQAVVTLSRLKDPRRLTVLGVGLLAVLMVVLALLIAQRSAWALLLGAALLSLSVMQPWRLASHQGAMARLYVLLRERDPGVPVYEVGGLAAWPHGHGHGWRLLVTLLVETDVEGYVVVFPRDARLRRRYLRMGMVEHEPDGALYLDLRTRPPHSSSP